MRPSHARRRPTGPPPPKGRGIAGRKADRNQAERQAATHRSQAR